MSAPLRELPGHDAIKALRQLEWRYQTLNEDYDAAIALEKPELEMHERTFQYSRRGQLYKAERRLHHYLAGYYTYWRQVMTVGHATDDHECRGRIENVRENHDDLDCARVTRGLRMYVQKENVLPILVYQSDHDNTTPKYAINVEDINREGLYEPSFDHYFGSVDSACLFPFEVISKNWEAVESLHLDVQELVQEHLEEEIEEYISRLEDLEDVAEDLPLTDLMEALLPSEDPVGTDIFQL